jgi:hypothetical protein
MIMVNYYSNTIGTVCQYLFHEFCGECNQSSETEGVHLTNQVARTGVKTFSCNYSQLPIASFCFWPRKKSITLSCTCMGFFFTSHSQTTIVLHPISCNAANPCASLSALRFNLVCQYSRFDTGILPSLQSWWKCQKQPCTKITALYLGNMISGCPGRSRR